MSNKNEEKQEAVEIPDEAVMYVINNYMIKKQIEGVPIAVGIGYEAAELVIKLFLDWAEKTGRVEDKTISLK